MVCGGHTQIHTVHFYCKGAIFPIFLVIRYGERALYLQPFRCIANGKLRREFLGARLIFIFRPTTVVPVRVKPTAKHTYKGEAQQQSLRWCSLCWHIRASTRPGDCQCFLRNVRQHMGYAAWSNGSFFSMERKGDGLQKQRNSR